MENLNGVYYFFECLDGVIGDRLITLEELRECLTTDPTPLTEKDAISIAKNYEADLYRYTYRDGEKVESKQLVELMF
jgi:hypothetical protein